MMILMSHATAFGSAAGTAEGIGAWLVKAGCEVDLRPVGDVEAVARDHQSWGGIKESAGGVAQSLTSA